ncbi:MAG: hypothetical protein EHM20_06245, partial [Alphaproteobacteria bacterium]
MLRELVNRISDPIISFPLATIGFYLMLKYYKIVGSKKFAYWTVGILIPVVAWFLSDPNFFSIIKTPDNIPIIILFIFVGFCTWLVIHQAAENDTRIESCLCKNEATTENREKV